MRRILSVLLLTATVWGNSIDPVGVLRSSAQFIRSAHYLSVAFELVQYYEAGDTLVQKGDLLLGTGEKFRMRLPGHEFYSDGMTLWEYRPGIRQVLVRSLNEMGSGFHPSKMLFQYLECTPLAAKEEQIAGTKLIRLTLNPQGKLAALQALEVWVNPTTKAPAELRATDRSGNQSRYRFSEIKVNQKMTGNEFVFVPQDGVELLDLR